MLLVFIHRIAEVATQKIIPVINDKYPTFYRLMDISKADLDKLIEKSSNQNDDEGNVFCF